jgi:hypothetical protein
MALRIVAIVNADVVAMLRGDRPPGYKSFPADMQIVDTRLNFQTRAVEFVCSSMEWADVGPPGANIPYVEIYSIEGT